MKLNGLSGKKCISVVQVNDKKIRFHLGLRDCPLLRVYVLVIKLPISSQKLASSFLI
jgi:hypothetical protein